MAVFDQGDMPTEALDRLASEIKHEMEHEFGLELCLLNPATSVCDEEYRMLEEARETGLRERK